MITVGFVFSDINVEWLCDQVVGFILSLIDFTRFRTRRSWKRTEAIMMRRMYGASLKKHLSNELWGEDWVLTVYRTLWDVAGLLDVVMLRENTLNEYKNAIGHSEVDGSTWRIRSTKWIKRIYFMMTWHLRRRMNPGPLAHGGLIYGPLSMHAPFIHQNGDLIHIV